MRRLSRFGLRLLGRGFSFEICTPRLTGWLLGLSGAIAIFTSQSANAQFQLIDTKAIGESWSLMTYRDQLADQRILVVYANDAKAFAQRTTGQVTAKLRIYCKQVTSYGIMGGMIVNNPMSGEPAYVGNDASLPFKDTHAVAELEFSSAIGFTRQALRYRFDDDPIHDMSIDGEYQAGQSILPLSGGIVVRLPYDPKKRANDTSALNNTKSASSEFILGMRKAARFKVSLDNLPWAGPTFFDFDVRGAGLAMDALPCR